jgi:hypothetical protein
VSAGRVLISHNILFFSGGKDRELNIFADNG